MTKWEYATVTVTQREFMDALRVHGLQGWELAGCLPCAVAVAPVPMLDHEGRLVTAPVGSQPTPGVLLIFKRPLVCQEEPRFIPRG